MEVVKELQLDSVLISMLDQYPLLIVKVVADPPEPFFL